MNELADAIRRIAKKIAAELDRGNRSTQIDANDLIDLFLAIADELDPPKRRTKS